MSIAATLEISPVELDSENAYNGSEQATVAAPHEDLESAVRRLFHMTLSSLRGYQELATLSAHPEIRTFLEVIARQRSAQCHALTQLSESIIPGSSNLKKFDDAALADPSAADIQIAWLRTVWNYEQEEYNRFQENLDQAELMLEDAFLNAAETYPDTEHAAVFRDLAISVCGARQCLEDIARERIIASRY